MPAINTVFVNKSERQRKTGRNIYTSIKYETNELKSRFEKEAAATNEFPNGLLLSNSMEGSLYIAQTAFSNAEWEDARRQKNERETTYRKIFYRICQLSPNILIYIAVFLLLML